MYVAGCTDRKLVGGIRVISKNISMILGKSENETNSFPLGSSFKKKNSFIFYSKQVFSTEKVRDISADVGLLSICRENTAFSASKDLNSFMV